MKGRRLRWSVAGPLTIEDRAGRDQLVSRIDPEVAAVFASAGTRWSGLGGSSERDRDTVIVVAVYTGRRNEPGERNVSSPPLHGGAGGRKMADTTNADDP